LLSILNINSTEKLKLLSLLWVLNTVVIYPQPATKNHTVALSLLLPQWDGEENQKQNAKLMGCNTDSLTERQREKKKTTIILIKSIQRAIFSLSDAQLAPE